MAKFCGNCGSKLNGGEPFCSQCGYRIENAPLQPAGSPNTPQYAPPPAPQAQPSYASPRPAPTPSYAAPQPTPAAVPSAPSPASAPAVTPAPRPQPVQPQPISPQAAPPAPQKAAPPSYADFSRTNQSGQQRNNNSPNKKGGCGKCFLILMLSGFIIALLTAGAVWYFGSDTDDRPKTTFYVRRHASKDKRDSANKSSSKPTAKPKASARPAQTRTAPSKADYGFPYAASVSCIKARYSEKDIKDAPQREAKVSPQNCLAVCGDVKADFRSWNLQGEDTFIVRTLPELTDNEAGYVIKAYDFSMASGQNEFATDVTLTVPRTAKNENEGFCVAFNDETQQWERVYSEISEDGKSYRIYTDHFCGKGEALPTNELTRQIAKEVTGEDLEKEHTQDYFTIYCYYNDSSRYQRMTSPVFVDYSYLWGAFQYKYAYTLNDVVDAIKGTPEDKLIYADPCPGFTFGCDAADTAGDSSDVLSGIGIIPKTEFFDKPSAVTTVIGWISTVFKMSSEIKSGKTVVDTALNNKLSIVSNSLGTAAMFVSNPPVATGIAASSLIVFGLSKIDDAAAPRELAPSEQIYRDYFYRYYEMRERKASAKYDKWGNVEGYSAKSENARHFYYDLSPGDERLSRPDAGNIKRISGLSDDENSILKRYINKGGLPGSDPRQKGEIPAEWAYSLKILYKICEKHPERLSQLVLDLYTNYAKSCWEMGDQKYKEFMEAAIKERNYTENALRLLTPEQQEVYTQNMVTEMMGSHSELIYELTTSAEHKSRWEIERLIEKDLLPKLNTMIEFRVTDETLENPEDFSKSVYGAKPIEGKDNPGLDGKYADWSKAETPMAFGIKKGGEYQPVSRPRFIPRRDLGSIGRFIWPGNKEDYFPYRPNFLPQAVSGDNLVFTCTYYHYLMMGAPTAIIFHKMGEKDDYEPVPFVLPQAPDADGVFRVTVKAPKKEIKETYVFADVAYCDLGDFGTNDKDIKDALTNSLKYSHITAKSDGSFCINGSGSIKIDDKDDKGTLVRTLSISINIEGKLDAELTPEIKEQLKKGVYDEDSYCGYITSVTGHLKDEQIGESKNKVSRLTYEEQLKGIDAKINGYIFSDRSGALSLVIPEIEGIYFAPVRDGGTSKTRFIHKIRLTYNRK